jgi:predicted nucleic acid-binding Zn ribbon protein
MGKRDWVCRNCNCVSPDVPVNVADQYCPYCGKLMEKIYSAPSLMFKGNGWTERHYQNGWNGKTA